MRDLRYFTGSWKGSSMSLGGAIKALFDAQGIEHKDFELLKGKIASADWNEPENREVKMRFFRQCADVLCASPLSPYGDEQKTRDMLRNHHD